MASHRRVQPDDLERGDHIIRRLDARSLGVPLANLTYHHGIYLGNKKVAHLGFPRGDKSQASARKDNFDKFACKRSVYLVPHWNLKRSKEEVAQYAENCIEKGGYMDDYHCIFKNCAHFVYECLSEDEPQVPFWKQEVFQIHENKKGEVVVGEVAVKSDGIGLNGKAVILKEEVNIGDTVVKVSAGSAEAGAKVWEKDVGLDLGFKANARAGSASVGPASIEVGPSLDTGVKAGKDGVGLTVFGVGAEIGKKTSVSLFGFKVGWDFS
uniref:LRAT domain-containing protein n=1 Tax=Panagrellus redivivus TaxID=6233 RepID=A0A7E4VZB5_PANRE